MKTPEEIQAALNSLEKAYFRASGPGLMCNVAERKYLMGAGCALLWVISNDAYFTEVLRAAERGDPTGGGG